MSASASRPGSHPAGHAASGVDGASRFDPSRVRIRNERDQIRSVAARFASSYGRELSSAAYWKSGSTKRDIYNALLALDTEAATAADVAQIIGNNSWIGESCDFCGCRMSSWLEMGDEPDYEARYLELCFACVADVAAIATEARRAETTKIGSVHEGAGPKDIAQNPSDPTP